MYMKNFITFISVIIFSSLSLTAQSQSHTVEGNVVDTNGEPLIGVSILELGTSSGTVTDMDGGFKLNVKSQNAILRFTYIGFKEQEIIVDKLQVCRMCRYFQPGCRDEYVDDNKLRDKNRE
jgi:hypothetical protein